MCFPEHTTFIFFCTFPCLFLFILYHFHWCIQYIFIKLASTLYSHIPTFSSPLFQTLFGEFVFDVLIFIFTLCWSYSVGSTHFSFPSHFYIPVPMLLLTLSPSISPFSMFVAKLFIYLIFLCILLKEIHTELSLFTMSLWYKTSVFNWKEEEMFTCVQMLLYIFTLFVWNLEGRSTVKLRWHNFSDIRLWLKETVL
jgi:hypothetical protein